MTKRILIAIAVICIAPAWANPDGDILQEVLALERQAMDGWLKGDPGPQLGIADSQITCFHAVAQKRVDGLLALKELYDRYRGTPLFDSYEIRDPKVQAAGNAAILTYQLAQHKDSVTTLWNGTQIYERRQGGWRLIHSHWSATQAQQP